MKPGILITGGQGQLGSELARRLPEAKPLMRAELDITQPDQIEAAFDREQPRLIINCAAYNKVDLAETEPVEAWQGNALGPRNLAQICRDRDCRLIHISTDFVFAGDRERSTPLPESELPRPVSVYGATKLAGEYFVRSICRDRLVIRTCGLYGEGGTGNFVRTMLRLGRAGKPLRVVDDQICSPTSISDLAEAILALEETQATGLFHVVNSGAVSWYDFATMIFSTAGIDADLSPVSSEDYAAPAERPAYSVLACGKYEQATGRKMRSIEEALGEYLSGETD
ncbi:dTDP-4-dehydrorhamnose reductase [Rubinisphaera margarita]|uniref:dTDP-4-dehydrorhamnose reductase n=1 Tax=Rubinisphaera margarita TaxID=2909586 RepID=UPI001EE8C312|nr:dTDP-4-dehydrorhamnose reductase [Rubinisphaera margarita]MCG6154412.1 dTDP-4-dehydrorhamnose reductase [Rubinisphaera margarita]